jgi:hypothetical protein
MREIRVDRGNDRWVVSLTDPEPNKWHVLRTFPTEQEAIEWAASLLNDLASQRAVMLV